MLSHVMCASIRDRAACPTCRVLELCECTGSFLIVSLSDLILKEEKVLSTVLPLLGWLLCWPVKQVRKVGWELHTEIKLGVGHWYDWEIPEVTAVAWCSKMVWCSGIIHPEREEKPLPEWADWNNYSVNSNKATALPSWASQLSFLSLSLATCVVCALHHAPQASVLIGPEQTQSKSFQRAGPQARIS